VRRCQPRAVLSPTFWRTASTPTVPPTNWGVGKLDDGVGRSLHQQGVAVTLVGSQQCSQPLRHRDGDVEIIGRQHLGRTGIEPILGLPGVAFGTGAVLQE